MDGVLIATELSIYMKHDIQQTNIKTEIQRKPSLHEEPLEKVSSASFYQMVFQVDCESGIRFLRTS